MKKTKKERRQEKRVKLKNRKLIKKYPWLIPRYEWGGDIIDNYDYSYIEWGCSRGWDLAYGDMYLEELGDAVEEAGEKNTFRIWQIKEKYGQHRIYHNSGVKKINRIVSKYEMLSGNICISCGKPDVPMINTGWYSPYCYECFYKMIRRREDYLEKGDPTYSAMTDEEIKRRYEECICDDDTNMPDSYIICRFGNGQDEVVDISETADKIRKRWEKRHKKKTVPSRAANASTLQNAPTE